MPNETKPIDLKGAVLLSPWCNIFGDDINGAQRILGGLESATGKKVQQWYCPTRSIGRFRMQCAHGHKGQIMKLCQKHLTEFSGGKIVFCPRCNIPPNDHKCKVEIKALS
jgi:hypothetical protein